MKMENRISLVGMIYSFILVVVFLGISIAILVSGQDKTNANRFTRHQSLHPMQFPFELTYNLQANNFAGLNVLVSDLSTVSFNTPGFPSKLASAVEIGMILNMSAAPTRAFYPIIDNMTKSSILFALSTYEMSMSGVSASQMMQALMQIQMHNNSNSVVSGLQMPKNIQEIFQVDDKLKSIHTKYYCPIRIGGLIETYAAWLTRTGQSTPTMDFNEKYRSHTEFSHNKIHEKKCHQQRTDSMVMAHVGVDSHTLFSVHSKDTLLLGVVIITLAFVGFACVNELYLYIEGKLEANKEAVKTNTDKQLHRKKEMKLHTFTTLLKLIVVVLVVILFAVEYIYKTNYIHWGANGLIPTSSFLAVFCPLVLTFLVLYMQGPIKIYGVSSHITSEIRDYCKSNTQQLTGYLSNMNINTVSEDERVNMVIEKGLFPSLDLTRNKMEMEKEVLMYTYLWFLTVPLFFMSMYAEKTYGVDLVLHLILLAVISGCILDILYTRVVLIIDVVWDIYIKNYRDQLFDGVKHPTQIVEEMRDSKYLMINHGLKFVMWILFTGVRFTLVLIAYLLFKKECEGDNCTTFEAFIYLFELTPVAVTLFDLFLVSLPNKRLDRSYFEGQPGIGGKNEFLRIMTYGFIYYTELAIACIVLVAIHLNTNVILPEDIRKSGLIYMS